MKTHKLVIVDDHKLFRNGLRLILESCTGISISYEASNGYDFLKKLDEKYNNEIILMDIDMPEMNGIEATQKAVEKYPGIKIIALSMYGDEEYYFQMIDAGVKGFLLKDSEVDEVIRALDTVDSGGTYFSDKLLFNIVKNIKKIKSINKIKQELSDRENEILYHICKGLPNHEIAHLLNISKRTVDKHRQHILEKTGTGNTAGMVAYAIKNKIVEL